MSDIPNPPQWKRPCECHDLAKAAMALSALDSHVQTMKRTGRVPSENLERTLRDQWAEVVRLAKKHIQQEQHDE